MNLITKDGENVGGRVTGLQLSSQWMRKKVFLGLFLICFQGCMKDGLEIGIRSCGRYLRHGTEVYEGAMAMIGAGESLHSSASDPGPGKRRSHWRPHCI
jgi:hypothetical protein